MHGLLEERAHEMTRLKSLLIAGGALLFLIGALALLPPTPSHSQTPPAGFPVEVVNTTGKAVPTSAQGTTTVAGMVALAPDSTVGLASGAKVSIDLAGNTVQLGNSPTVALATNANTVQIGNTPTVGISPDANSVKISNTASSAAFVRDVDEGARQPYQGEATITLADNANVGMATLLTVPAGKRLVVEQVSARVTVPGGFQAVVFVETRVNNVPARHFLDVNFQPFSPFGLDRVSVTQLMKFYADPGTPVAVAIYMDSGLPPGLGGLQTVVASVSGYFVDVP
jgi:hypothetical protein